MRTYFYYAFVPCFVAPLAAGLYVYHKKGPTRTALWWLALSMFVSSWAFSYWRMVASETINQAHFWIQTLYTLAIPIYPIYVGFIFSLLPQHRWHRPALWVCFVIAAFLLVLLHFSGAYLGPPRFDLLIEMFYPNPGPLHSVHLTAYVGLPSVGVVAAVQELRRSDLTVLARNRLKYVVLASITGFLFGASTFTPMYNLGPHYMAPFTWVYCLIVAVAIVKYQLMDIHVVVSRTALLVALIIAFITVHWVLGKALGRWLGNTGTLAFSGAIFISVLLLRNTRERLEEIFDSLANPQSHAYQMALRELARGLNAILELDKLAAFLGEVLTETMGAKDVTIWLEDLKQERYRLIWPSEKTSVGASLHFEHLLIKQLGKLKRATTREDLTIAEFPGMCGLVIVPFMVRNDHLLGFFCLGEKLERQSYKTSDLEALEALAAQAAIAIENARLYTLAVTEERSGLYTPQHFRQRFEQEFQRCRRDKKALMIGLVELPFDCTQDKPVNFDAKLLPRLGEVIKKGIRSSDIPALLEDNSIVILFPETGRAEADPRTARVSDLVRLALTVKNVLERVRRNLANTLGMPVAAGATAYGELFGFAQDKPSRTTFEGKDSDAILEQLLAEAREGARLSREHGADAVYFPPTSPLAEVFKNPPPLEFQDDHLWTVGDLALQPSARKLFIHHNTQDPSWKEIPVSLKEFDLLRFMIQRQGRILTRQFLTEAVWGYEYLGFSRNIDTHISKLREKLKGSRCLKIETVKHAGYRLLVSETPSA